MMSSAECLPQAAEYARLAREAEGRRLVRDVPHLGDNGEFAAQLKALAVLERAEKAPPKRG